MNFALTAELQLFREMVHDLAAKEVASLARHTDETGEFNWRAVRKMGPLGMLGLQVPEAYGGAALDTISAAIAIEELGWACGSTALAVSAHNNLGIGPPTRLRDRAAEATVTFGKPIGQHQAIQFMLADAATEIQSARLMIYWAAWLKDQDKPYAKEAGMAKLMATEIVDRYFCECALIGW